MVHTACSVAPVRHVGYVRVPLGAVGQDGHRLAGVRHQARLGGGGDGGGFMWLYVAKCGYRSQYVAAGAIILLQEP